MPEQAMIVEADPPMSKFETREQRENAILDQRTEKRSSLAERIDAWGSLEKASTIAPRQNVKPRARNESNGLLRIWRTRQDSNL